MKFPSRSYPTSNTKTMKKDIFLLVMLTIFAGFVVALAWT